MEDYGKELNQRIKEARARYNLLTEQLYNAENHLFDLEQDRNEAREECHFCNDCSMCIP
jgi:hypothetical protein